MPACAYMPRSKFILTVSALARRIDTQIHAVVDANGNLFIVKLKSTKKSLSDTNGVTCGWFAGTSVCGVKYETSSLYLARTQQLMLERISRL
jgi:ABC-type nitrate/sulfonate/bicarbonate transport system substrate-binding protein